MLLYENAKKFFADKLAADCTGHGRFESAFFHTIKKVHDDAHAESAAHIATLQADIKTMCAAIKKVHDDAHAESAAHIATLQADIKTMCAAIKTSGEGNAELLRQRESWLAICRSVVECSFSVSDLRAMKEFIATAERKPV